MKLLSLRALLATMTIAVVPLTLPVAAKVIGTNTPAPPLNVDRLEQLPAEEQAAWRAYLQRSAALMRQDRAALAAELPPGATPPPPSLPHGAGTDSMPMDREPAWYASEEARRIADTVVSYQTPAGGWSKNQDRAGPKRLPGQAYVSRAGAAPVAADPSNFDAPDDPSWAYVGTIDNDATTGELGYLARLAEALPGSDGDPYRASFVKGVRYLLQAQFPNGGFPQVYPLQGGYHDGITFNDGGMAMAVMLLDSVAQEPRFAFVPQEVRVAAAGAVDKAIDVILRAQVRVDGRPTGWPQQVDALTLEPISARNYEMRSIASAETTDVLLFLMSQPNPTPAIREAIESGIAWLRSKATYDKAFTRVGDEGRKLIDQPGAGPIWSRNYDIATGQPIFGDRDKTIHDDVNTISQGRRNGYSWWGNTPERALAAFSEWQQRVGAEAASG